MDYSQDKPIHELIGIADDNSDVTLEELRMILADEMTVEDIYDRRRRKAEQIAFEGNVLDCMARYAEVPTRQLLHIFRDQRGTWGDRYSEYGGPIGDYWAKKDFSDHVRKEAMKRVLSTREHVITSKREGHRARRKAATAHHGDKKLRKKKQKEATVERQRVDKQIRSWRTGLERKGFYL